MGWSCRWMVCSVVRNFHRGPFLIWRIFWAYHWIVSMVGCHFNSREWTDFRSEFKGRIKPGILCLYTVQMPAPRCISLTLRARVCVCVYVCVCVTENTKDLNTRISDYNLKYCINFFFCYEEHITCVITYTDENCAVLVYYAGSSGTLLPTFRDNLSVPEPWGWD